MALLILIFYLTPDYPAWCNSMCLTSQTENETVTTREMEQTYELAPRKYILMIARGVTAGSKVYSLHQFRVYKPTVVHGDGTWLN